MKVVIHQAYFLPWLGYFSKLAYADAFVVLDNVEFSKRHYMDRTRIINMKGIPQWIGLPIGQHFKEICSRIVVHDKSHLKKILLTIQQSYTRADYFEREMPCVQDIITSEVTNQTSLVDINIAMVAKILGMLEINAPKMYYSSALSNAGNASDRLLDICRTLKADTLIIGKGKSLQNHRWEKLKALNVKLMVQDYLQFHPEYKQVRRKREGFVRGLSIIDSLLNAGRDKVREFLINPKVTPALMEL